MASSTPRTLWAGRLSTTTMSLRLSQTLLEVGQKDFAVHCSVDQHRRDYSGETQARNECHGLPVAQWHISDQELSARTAAIRSYHVGADRGLVDEHQSGRVKKPLLTNPASTCPSDVGALLFRRAQAFLTVVHYLARKRQSAVR